MTSEIWFALALTNFLACLAPGQNTALVGGTVLQTGIRSGAAVATGILIAELAWAVLALILVLGAIELNNSLIFWLKLAGAPVLIWFGYAILFAAKADSVEQRLCSRAEDAGMAARGLCIGITNPMALIFFLSVFPQFVLVEQSQLSAASTVFYISAVVISAALGIAPYLALAKIMEKSTMSQYLQKLSGVILIVFGLFFLVEGFF